MFSCWVTSFGSEFHSFTAPHNVVCCPTSLNWGKVKQWHVLSHSHARNDNFSSIHKGFSWTLRTFVPNPRVRATRAALFWTICSLLRFTCEALDQTIEQLSLYDKPKAWITCLGIVCVINFEHLFIMDKVFHSNLHAVCLFQDNILSVITPNIN